MPAQNIFTYENILCRRKSGCSDLKAQNIEASVDGVSGVVKISDLELFDVNSYELSDKGKQYLAKFSPAYLDSIFSNEYLNKNIEKIIIKILTTVKIKHYL